MTLDLGVLNSATKYPSIDTYHTLNPANGGLLDEVMLFTGTVVLTEKVNGCNGRIIVLPDGDWFLGSREELLYARGDRIENPTLSIVPVLKPLLNQITGRERSGLGTPGIEVYFLEIYGHRIGSAAKQYTVLGNTGCRLFDIAWVPMTILNLPRPAVAGWRNRGGQLWNSEEYLQHAARETGIKLTPRLGTVDARELPVRLEDTPGFLLKYAPHTQTSLDADAGGAAEGIVLRTENRITIAKARFEDYERTFRLRKKKS